MKEIMNEEIERLWIKLKEKMMETIRFLKEKYGKKENNGDQSLCNGVRISEDWTKNEEETEKADEKVVKEGVETNDDEDAYLKIPNKMSDNTTFDKIKMMSDIQMMLFKIRMSVRKRNEDDKSGMNAEELENVKTIERDARNVVNMEEMTVDFAKRRVTDMKTCRRITLPKCLDGDTEAKLKTLEGSLEGAVLREEKRAENRKKNETVLTDKEVRGKISIKKREKAGELVYMTCDKSGMNAVVGPENFVDKMNEHMKNDDVVTREEVEEEEKRMSAMAGLMARVLRMGEDWDQSDRVHQAVTSVSTGIPALDGMLKDHKMTDILPVRPVCRAGRSPNGILSDITSDILVAVSRDITDRRAIEHRRINGEPDLISDLGEVRSTEELQAKVRECNRAIERLEEEYKAEGLPKPTVVVGSNDVKALYPSCLTVPSAAAVRRKVEECKLDINVNETELSLFLASTLTQEEVNAEGLGRLVHTRKKVQGSRPEITSLCVTGSEEKRKIALSGMWRKPTRKPTPEQKKKMIGLMVEIAVKKVMTCHFYKFAGVIRRQKDGGSIGLRQTGDVASLVMVEWDEEARKRIKDAEIKELMYGRYVDDIDHVYVAVKKGTRYNRETRKTEIDQEKIMTDMLREDDIITFEVITDIMNSVNDDIQLTSDVPSINTDKSIPVLDMSMKIVDNRLRYTFYSKPMATRYLIPFRSAHPAKLKRSTLTQEGVRRLMNVSPEYEEEERTRVMTEFDLKLRYSGYKKKFRFEVIEAAYGIYNKKLAQEEDGTRPLYRHREWNRANRELQKTVKRENWYKGEGPTPNMAPLILDPTPSGKLVEEIKAICKEFDKTHNIGIKIMERGGRKMTAEVKSDPLGDKLCRREKCTICKGNKPGKCDIASCGYRQTCVECREVGIMACYEGESSLTAFQRTQNHEDDMRKEDLESPMYKHCTIAHNSRKVEFEVEVTGIHKTVMGRMTDELVRIKHSTSDVVLNSKNDWTQPALVRVIPITGNRLETQVGDTLPGRAERRAVMNLPQSQSLSQSQSQRVGRSQAMSQSPPQSQFQPQSASQGLTDGLSDTQSPAAAAGRTRLRGQRRGLQDRVQPGEDGRQRRTRVNQTQRTEEPVMTAEPSQPRSHRTERTRRTTQTEDTAGPSVPAPRTRRRRAEGTGEEEEEVVLTAGDRGERRARRQGMRD